MAVKYIAVDGPIGVGKTTIAKILTNHYSGRLVLENHEENPFLSVFYKDREKFAFQTQIFFLLSRFKQQQELLSGELIASRVISDYFFGKDRIFATLNLNRDEFALYEHIASLFEKNIPLPDLVLYLTATPQILMKRINDRNLPHEKNIDIDYLNRVCESYSKYFFHYNLTPLLVVNTENVNFATEPGQFEYLVEKIENMEQGTSYLVPAGES
jgi:deoxyguanosine kinase